MPDFGVEGPVQSLERPPGSAFALLRIPRLGQLLNVVHHAVKVPLRVDLGAATVVQSCQALVVADVAKHRLYGAYALAV